MDGFKPNAKMGNTGHYAHGGAVMKKAKGGAMEQAYQTQVRRNPRDNGVALGPDDRPLGMPTKPKGGGGMMGSPVKPKGGGGGMGTPIPRKPGMPNPRIPSIMIDPRPRPQKRPLTPRDNGGGPFPKGPLVMKDGSKIPIGLYDPVDGPLGPRKPMVNGPLGPRNPNGPKKPLISPMPVNPNGPKKPLTSPMPDSSSPTGRYPGGIGFVNDSGMARYGKKKGGMAMVMKGGKKVPSFAADGKGKMFKGGMAKGKK